MNKVYEKVSQMSNNEFLLIEYNMFFGELSDICFFVIDDTEELQELKKVLEEIKSIDGKSLIFCCTYGIDRSNDRLFIYCDNLLISTFLSIEELQTIFSKYDTLNNLFRGIVPSSIDNISEEDIDDEKIKYIIYENGIIKEYHNEIIEIDKTKSLLWD